MYKQIIFSGGCSCKADFFFLFRKFKFVDILFQENVLKCEINEFLYYKNFTKTLYTTLKFVIKNAYIYM